MKQNGERNIVHDMVIWKFNFCLGSSCLFIMVLSWETEKMSYHFPLSSTAFSGSYKSTINNPHVEFTWTINEKLILPRFHIRKGKENLDWFRFFFSWVKHEKKENKHKQRNGGHFKTFHCRNRNWLIYYKANSLRDLDLMVEDLWKR